MNGFNLIFYGYINLFRKPGWDSLSTNKPMDLCS